MLPPSSGEQSLGDLRAKLRDSHHLYSAAEVHQLLASLGYPPEIIAQVVADWETGRPHFYSIIHRFITWPTFLMVVLLNTGLWLIHLATDLSSFQQALALLFAIACAGGTSFVMARRPLRTPLMRRILSGVLVTSVLWGGILMWEWWHSSASTLLRIYETLVTLIRDYQ
jgi:hypothetical protein